LLSVVNLDLFVEPFSMPSVGKRSFIVGAGCTAFIKPRALRTTEDMGLEAATKALLDAGRTLF